MALTTHRSRAAGRWHSGHRAIVLRDGVASTLVPIDPDAVLSLVEPYLIELLGRRHVLRLPRTR